MPRRPAPLPLLLLLPAAAADPCGLEATFANGARLTASLVAPTQLAWSGGADVTWTRGTSGSGCLGDWADSGGNAVVVTATTITGPDNGWYPATVTQYHPAGPPPPTQPPAPPCVSPCVAGPCDIYDAAGTPCVAAHSTVRALYGRYNGPLYRVARADDAAKDIGVLAEGGFADSAAQDAFCGGSSCVIQRIYDQSPQQNHLDKAPPGGASHRTGLVNAAKEKLTVGGHPVYAAYFEGGMGYRIDKTKGIATGNEPESLYMVTSGRHYNTECCFDYGNAETNNNDDGAGTMEAVYWGNWSHGPWRGAGKGPWVMADLENGIWGGANAVAPNDTPITADFVTAMVKGKSDGFALKGGDAQKGTLQSLYDGPRPGGYQPMKKQGAIILGIGGDNSNSAVGTFYEGVMTSGFASDATDAAVQANIVAAGYGK